MRELEEEVFVYDPRSDRVALLNASAALVLDLCDGKRSIDEIAVEIAEIYQTDPANLMRDVRAAVVQLATEGLLMSQGRRTVAAIDEPDP